MEHVLPFLKKLKKNNNKEWFDKHKDEYLEAKAEVEKLVGDVLSYKFDDSLGALNPKKCIFRIYRDTRFSKDKTPYKQNMGASMAADGKKLGRAGYYIHIEPGNCFLGGGIYMPEPEVLKKIRQEIDYNGKELKKIISAKPFKKYFDGMWMEESLQRVPKDYSADHEMAEYLKLKHFIVTHEFDDALVNEKNFAKHCASAFKETKVFNDFLNRVFE